MWDTWIQIIPVTTSTHRNRGQPSCLESTRNSKWIHTGELEGSYSTIKYQHSHICIALVASLNLSHFENHTRVAFIYLGNWRRLNHVSVISITTLYQCYSHSINSQPINKVSMLLETAEMFFTSVHPYHAREYRKGETEVGLKALRCQSMSALNGTFHEAQKHQWWMVLLTDELEKNLSP